MRKESTTSFMRRGFISTLAVCAALLSSCSSDSDLNSTDPISKTTNSISAESHDKNTDAFKTRSELYFTSRGMSFKWTGDDELSIFAKDNYSATQLFKLKSGTGSTLAEFSSTDFSLTKDQFYFALSKSANTKKGETQITQLNTIYLDYAGQTQKGNANTSHLGDYDYMVAATKCEDVAEKMHFSFTHLGATLRVWMWPESSELYNDFRATEFTEMEVYDSENSYKQPKRFFSFEAGMGADGVYRPIWPSEQDITVSSPRFTLKLENKTDNTKGIYPTDAFEDGSYDNSTDASGNLLTYIEVPPVNLTGKTLGFIIKGKKEVSTGVYENVTYYGTTPGFNIEADNAYQCNIKLKKPTTYNVTLKINHMWQHGATEEVTRATGDPGLDKEIGLPAHVYYIFCVDGKVRAVKHLGTAAQELAVNHFITSTTEGTDWETTKTDGEYISTLKDAYKLVFNVPEQEAGIPKRLYVVASKEAIPDSKFTSVTNGASEETVVRALTYDLPASNIQVYLRDLYSTPWQNNVTFVGNLTDPTQDVFLYHTAAKVDLKWNSADEMNVTTEDANSLIKVSNVKNSNLSLFKPTTNANGSGSYTVTTPITYGTYVNGRQVYYLPQFSDNTYNVTIGAKTGNIQFKETSTDGGFTSWYRALITQ